MRRRFTRDHFGGAMLVAIGAAVVVAALGYRMGSLRQMGSGFFPAALGVLLAAVGVAMLAATPWRAPPAQPDGGVLPDAVPANLGSEHAHLSGPPVQWRGWLCILGGVAAFVALGEHGGLAPASFACVFVSALGDRRNGVASAALLAAAMTLLGVAVFHFGLHLALPLFTWN